MVKPPKTSLNPVLGLVTALFISLVGMVSVYLAGNARGYDPSLTILVRNLFLMAFFFVIYALLKKNYRGDFSILVVVALLTSVGFTIQYRISSAINVDFQKTLVKQYSAAAAKKIEADSLQTEWVLKTVFLLQHRGNAVYKRFRKRESNCLDSTNSNSDRCSEN